MPRLTLFNSNRAAQHRRRPGWKRTAISGLRVSPPQWAVETVVPSPWSSGVRNEARALSESYRLRFRMIRLQVIRVDQSTAHCVALPRFAMIWLAQNRRAVLQCARLKYRPTYLRRLAFPSLHEIRQYHDHRLSRGRSCPNRIKAPSYDEFVAGSSDFRDGPLRPMPHPTLLTLGVTLR